MNPYELVEKEVNKRIEWAKKWQLDKHRIFATTNIDAGYDAIRKFETRLGDAREMLLLNSLLWEYKLYWYVNEKLKTAELADSLRIRLGKAIDEMADSELR